MNYLNRAICWILRSHRWRRLRKAEKLSRSDFPEHERICARCLVVRQVRQRKVKEAA